MPIEKDENHFYFWPDSSETPALGIETDRLQLCIDEVLSRGLKGIFGTSPYFRGGSLDFLRQLPDLVSVEFWEVPIDDLSPLYDLAGLRHLRLFEGKRPGLEFHQLSQLRSLVWEYSKKDIGSDALSSLELLHLWRYKSSSGDMSGLELPANLTELELLWCNAVSLDGITSLPQLKRLRIARCRNLSSISALAKSCSNLEHLTITASGRVKAEEGARLASRLPKIRHLWAGDRKIR